MKGCGGTNELPGARTANITVIGTGSALGQTQSQQQVIPVTIVILPGTGGNPYYSFTPAGGCDTTTVTYSSSVQSPRPLINPFRYNWDFGSGVTDTGASPDPITYNTPGQYSSTLSIDEMEYFVQSITATVSGDWWCGDVEEPNLPLLGCQGAPDVRGSVVSGDSTRALPEKTNTTSPSWTGINLGLPSQSVAISFFDEDNVSTDDNAGLAVLTINGTGTYPFNTTAAAGSGGIAGTMTVGIRVKSTLTFSDTLEIFPLPAVPQITVTGDTICDGDSVVLSVSNPSASGLYQWYNDTTIVIGADSTVLVARGSGKYYVRVTDAITSCASRSADYTVVVGANPPGPLTILYNGPQVFVSPFPASGFTARWYKDGVEIPNQTGKFMPFLGTGVYRVEVFNSAFPQCNLVSDTQTVINSIDEMPFAANFRIYPNPGNGKFVVEYDENAGLESLDIRLFDLIGREVFQTSVNGLSGSGKVPVSSGLSTGVFQLQLTDQKGRRMSHKLVIY